MDSPKKSYFDSIRIICRSTNRSRSVGVVHFGGTRGKRRWRVNRQFVILEVLAEEKILAHLFFPRRFRRRQRVLIVLLEMILQSECPAVGRAAYVTAELEIVVLLVRLDVGADGVERRERPRAFGASERLRVTVLVAGQLHPRLERLRTVWTRVSALLAVRQ